MTRSASAPGKIILSGEYAVVAGYPGIAVPSRPGMHVTYAPDMPGLWTLAWPGMPDGWEDYVREILDRCAGLTAEPLGGTVSIRSALPLGKGMGSSTALVVALCRCLIGDDFLKAREVEDAVNTGNSGLDLAVIWKNAPVLFRKGMEPQPIGLDLEFLENAVLIDTGLPEQTTAELVAWVTEQTTESMKESAFGQIASCTERLLDGEAPETVFPDHHRAQCALGIVPDDVRQLIGKIEKAGGAAKVIGAGGRTGGGGMVLALHEDPDTVKSIAELWEFGIMAS
jgi:mevalonate kinase